MLELPEEQGQVSYGKPTINALFSVWETTMGYPITVKKTENRRFANMLINREGLQRVTEYVALSYVARSDQYAPRITSLIDLYYKWDKLTEWAMRKQSSFNDVISLD